MDLAKKWCVRAKWIPHGVSPTPVQFRLVHNIVESHGFCEYTDFFSSAVPICGQCVVFVVCC